MAAVTAIAAASLAGAVGSPERAEAACAAEVCTEMDFVTDRDGLYVLVITPFMLEFMLPEELRDCVWDVEATFSDGSPPEQHVFDAAKPFSAAHQFPEPGTYLVTVLATNGIQADNGEPCPSIQIDATVLYPEPPPPPPPPPDPAPDPEGPPETIGPTTSPPDALLQPAAGAPSASPQAASYWRRCGALLVHSIGCRRAARVVGAARSLLSRARRGRFAGPPSFEVLGFDCRVRRHAGRPLSCRRPGRRVLAPL